MQKTCMRGMKLERMLHAKLGRHEKALLKKPVRVKNIGEAREARDTDRVQQFHEDKRAKSERNHQLRCINSKYKFTLLTELLKQCKGPDEMESMPHIIPHVISAGVEPPDIKDTDHSCPIQHATVDADNVGSIWQVLFIVW